MMVSPVWNLACEKYGIYIYIYIYIIGKLLMCLIFRVHNLDMML